MPTEDNGKLGAGLSKVSTVHIKLEDSFINKQYNNLKKISVELYKRTCRKTEYWMLCYPQNEKWQDFCFQINEDFLPTVKLQF
jgi:hypothetical protein